MSKFFYHGKASNLNERGSGLPGSEKKTFRLGTRKAPANISVTNQARKEEVESILLENKWVGVVSLDADKDEDIRDLEMLQNKTVRAVSAKQAKRNDPCPCGSEKKYKNCCGL